MSAPIKISGSIHRSEELESYTQLMRSLLPRMIGVSVFNGEGDVCWSSEMAVDSSLGKLVSEGMRTAADDPGTPGVWITDGEPIYIFWLWPNGEAGSGPPFAAVLLRCRAGPESEQRSLSFVYSLVRPALQILTNDLQNRARIASLNGSLAEQDQDLDMLLEVSGEDHNAEEGGGDELKSVLRAAIEHIEGGLAAIIVPERGLVLVRQQPDHPIEASLVARAHRHLMSSAQLKREAVIVNQMQLQSPGGTHVYRVVSCAVTRNDGRAIGVLALFRPTTMPEFTPRQARLAELLARRVSGVIASSYDGLTGLLNRPAFEQRVRHSLAQPTSTQRWWSALAIDINRTHVINDSYGMHVGDKVIAQVGELLRRQLIPGSIAARISGDRFAALVPASLDDSARLAETVRQGAEQIGPGLGDGSLAVSVSIGVAAVDPRSQEFSHAFAAAETACKAANDRGRNRVELFQEADESIVRRFADINMVGDLRGAIAAGRMRLYAQLLLPLDGSQRPPHFEVLLRMLDANGETMGPARFMSAAQRYQLMPDIDRFVVSQTLQMLKPHDLLLSSGAVVFSMNCSGQSLKDDSFTDFIEKQIAESGVNPKALCFELTEGAAVGQLAHTETLMRRLRKLGCGIALDDFGTGLSSLAYLRSLPISMLKIDGSFVRDVLKDGRAESTIQAIAQLARAMNLVTVAEYVETDEIRRRIAQLGVDYGQGFAIGQPQPLPEILEQLPLYTAVSAGTGETNSGTQLPVLAV